MHEAMQGRGGFRKADSDRWQAGRGVRSIGLLAVATALLVAGGCSLSAGEATAASGSFISREDIRERVHLDTYEIVRQLRPAWVRARGSPSLQGRDQGFAVVYIDQSRFGMVDSLRQIDPVAIAEIRYMNPSDATTRFGTGHMGGAILVTTVSGR